MLFTVCVMIRCTFVICGCSLVKQLISIKYFEVSFSFSVVHASSEMHGICSRSFFFWAREIINNWEGLARRLLNVSEGIGKLNAKGRYLYYEAGPTPRKCPFPSFLAINLHESNKWNYIHFFKSSTSILCLKTNFSLSWKLELPY